MINAPRVEPNSLRDHAEGRELVRMDPEGMVLAGLFEELHAGTERPGALLAAGFDRDAREFPRNLWEHLLHDHPCEVIQAALEGLPEERGRNDRSLPVLARADDRSQHLELCLGREAVAALNLHG